MSAVSGLSGMINCPATPLEIFTASFSSPAPRRPEHRVQPQTQTLSHHPSESPERPSRGGAYFYQNIVQMSLSGTCYQEGKTMNRSTKAPRLAPDPCPRSSTKSSITRVYGLPKFSRYKPGSLILKSFLHSYSNSWTACRRCLWQQVLRSSSSYGTTLCRRVRRSTTLVMEH